MSDIIKKQVEDIIEEEVKEKDKDEWADLALQDNLTGLYNRNAYDMIVDELKDDIKYFFIVDVDHFKNVNDEYGHLIGDEVLIELANLLSEDFLVSRWGGEEFIGLLTDDNPEKILSKVREKIENTKFTSENLDITVTIGYTDFDVKKDIDAVFQEADAALYCGKESGRNMVVKYEEDMEDVCPAHIKNEDGELVKNEECVPTEGEITKRVAGSSRGAELINIDTGYIINIKDADILQKLYEDKLIYFVENQSPNQYYFDNNNEKNILNIIHNFNNRELFEGKKKL